MKFFAGFSKNYSLVLFHSNNLLRLDNMFLMRNQLFGIGLNIPKSINGSTISKRTPAQKVSYKYLSVVAEIENLVGTSVATKKVDQRKSPPGKDNVNTPTLIEQWKSSAEIINTNHLSNDRIGNIVRSMKTLIKVGTWDTNHVNQLCAELMNNNLKPNIGQNINILYCIASLRINNPKLVIKVLKGITPLLFQVYKPSPYIISIVTSMRYLNFRDIDTLTEIIKWCNNNKEKMNIRNTGAVIQSLAVLNYFPLEADKLLEHLLNDDAATNKWDCSSSIEYLNFVWSLTLLDRVSPEMAQSVLIPEFRKQIYAFLDSRARVTAYMKLLNIYSNASFRKFPIKMDKAYSSENPDLVHLKNKRQEEKCVKSMIDGLAHTLPFRTFNTFVMSDFGFVIDAVCFFDKHGVPISEIQYVKAGSGIKVALIVLLYKDLCQPNKDVPNGIAEFEKKCLINANHKALLLPYTEFTPEKTLKQKSDYLIQMIREAVPNFGLVK